MGNFMHKAVEFGGGLSNGIDATSALVGQITNLTEAVDNVDLPKITTQHQFSLSPKSITWIVLSVLGAMYLPKMLKRKYR
jgi:hypothetical protein